MVKSAAAERIPGEHLAPSVREVLAWDTEARIQRIEASRWIGYTQALQVLGRMEDLLRHPPTHRMPNLLLVGETNNGKTAIVERFRQLHPAHDNPDGDGISLPVLYVEAPPGPDEHRFFDRILEAVYAPYKPNDKISKKEFQVYHLLARLGVRMLVIDEIQQVLAGTLNRQRQFLKVLKGLGNELRIPIVGVGTPEAFNALQTDAQLQNRFRPMPLSRWKAGTEYDRLLASFEHRLPLAKPSHLTEPSLALKIRVMSEGWIGEITALLGEAAVKAVRTGRERIDAQLLDTLGWVPPTKRNRQ